MEIIYNFRILAYRLMTGYTIQISGHGVNIQWNLPNLDTIGTHVKCPDYRGVLISEVNI